LPSCGVGLRESKPRANEPEAWQREPSFPPGSVRNAISNQFSAPEFQTALSVYGQDLILAASAGYSVWGTLEM